MLTHQQEEPVEYRTSPQTDSPEAPTAKDGYGAIRLGAGCVFRVFPRVRTPKDVSVMHAKMLVLVLGVVMTAAACGGMGNHTGANHPKHHARAGTSASTQTSPSSIPQNGGGDGDGDNSGGPSDGDGGI